MTKSAVPFLLIPLALGGCVELAPRTYSDYEYSLATKCAMSEAMLAPSIAEPSYMSERMKAERIEQCIKEENERIKKEGDKLCSKPPGPERDRTLARYAQRHGFEFAFCLSPARIQEMIVNEFIHICEMPPGSKRNRALREHKRKYKVEVAACKL